MDITNVKINTRNLGAFRFKKVKDSYLITNDLGDYEFLSEQEFDFFYQGKFKELTSIKYTNLKNSGFICDKTNLDSLAEKYQKRNSFLFQGTSLHIIVITLRCDHKCIYCQAKAGNLQDKDLDMDIPTAKSVVDKIFQSPSNNITIEFQGGEPLINFSTLKFIVQYALKKNKELNKNLRISLVSNFTFMTDEILNFLMVNNVTICTSLDGIKYVHNKNRVSANKKDNYDNVVAWIKKIKAKIDQGKIYKYKVNALTTITRYSLPYPIDIVNEFLNLNLEGIHLRLVTPFGIKPNIWEKINYSSYDFIEFYKKALEYIIDLNIKGKHFYEVTAKILLTKILTSQDPNFLDLRSPCGASIGQLAYNFNGDVYTCDEGRMLSRRGDDLFKVGNVRDNIYRDFIDNDTTKTMCIASCLDNLYQCDACAYKPYCGVCPISNYVTGKDLFRVDNDKCKVMTLIFDYLFEKLKDDKIKEIFKIWLGKETNQ